MASRRSFLRRISLIGAAGVGAAVTSGCEAEAEQGAAALEAAGAGDPCSDLSGLTEGEIRARAQVGYVAQSPLSDTTCDNCQFWIGPKGGTACGRCVVIKGGIHPDGYCNSWAPQTEA